MIHKPPECFYFAAGSATGTTELNAFDHALLDAGVGDLNLIRISSILPPYSIQVAANPPPPGYMIPCAYATHITDRMGEKIAAAVGVGIPKDRKQAGLIMEYHAKYVSADHAEMRVRQMVEEGMMKREREIAEILTISAELVLEDPAKIGAVFAGVVLWEEED